MKNHVVTAARRCGRLLLPVAVLLLCQSTTAQTAVNEQLPASVVLVLKLVSATHVRPTTGVVISEDGLVIVPADFVSAGDEIVVMDGGTDILSHARPARTVKRSAADGLAVLSVEGLSRPAIKLSQTGPLTATVLHLAAFPPAEKMAEGAAPLWLPVKFLQRDSTASFSISPETPLPNISGVIIDRCGQLAGLNLAEGSQSLDLDKTPRLLVSEDLNRVFATMQITLPLGDCGKAMAQAGGSQALADIDEDMPSGSPEPVTELTAPASGLNRDEKQGDRPASRELPNGAEQDSSAEKNSNAASKVALTQTSVISTIPWWLWLTGVLLLMVLIAKGVMYLRITRKDSVPPAHDLSTSSASVSSEEPDTADLLTGSDAHALKSGVVESQLPDINKLPDGFDCIVLIEGSLGDNSTFRRFCVANTTHIDIVIGRGDADIAIETRSISRYHARLKGVPGSLTLSDLGSSNGTFIRGIPCLATEIMFIEPEDEILLGDVCFRIQLQTRDAGST